MEAVVLETLSSETLGRRSCARTAKRTRSSEANVIEQDDKNVRRSVGRLQRLDRRELCLRVLRVEGQGPVVRPVRNRKNISLDLGGAQTRTTFLCHDLRALDNFWNASICP
jgi:hypothetical protein